MCVSEVFNVGENDWCVIDGGAACYVENTLLIQSFINKTNHQVWDQGHV